MPNDALFCSRLSLNIRSHSLPSIPHTLFGSSFLYQDHSEFFGTCFTPSYVQVQLNEEKVSSTPNLRRARHHSVEWTQKVTAPGFYKCILHVYLAYLALLKYLIQATPCQHCLPVEGVQANQMLPGSTVYSLPGHPSSR